MLRHFVSLLLIMAMFEPDRILILLKARQIVYYQICLNFGIFASPVAMSC